MYITSNNSATAAKYAQSVLSNPKIQLTEQQKSDVDAIAKSTMRKNQKLILKQPRLLHLLLILIIHFMV